MKDMHLCKIVRDLNLLFCFLFGNLPQANLLNQVYSIMIYKISTQQSHLLSAGKCPSVNSIFLQDRRGSTINLSSVNQQAKPNNYGQRVHQHWTNFGLAISGPQTQAYINSEARTRSS